jgi:hypothetical protein
MLVRRMVDPARVETQLYHLIRNSDAALQAPHQLLDHWLMNPAGDKTSCERLEAVIVALCCRDPIHHCIEEINERQTCIAGGFPIDDTDVFLLLSEDVPHREIVVSSNERGGCTDESRGTHLEPVPVFVTVLEKWHQGGCRGKEIPL